MLIAIDQMPHKGGTEYLNSEAIIRVAPLEYVEDGKLYEGSVIYLEGGQVVESSNAPEEVAKQIELGVMAE